MRIDFPGRPSLIQLVPELELWVECDAEAVLVGVEVHVAVLGERLVDEGLAKVGDDLGRFRQPSSRDSDDFLKFLSNLNFKYVNIFD